MSNEEYRDILETKRVEIVKSINCERSLLLDHLRSNLVFDQEDCELIRAATTNDARVGKLVDFLQRKGPEAYQHFLDVVQIESPSLYEILTGEKANSKTNPLMRQIAFPEIKPGEFFQIQPLVEYQQRMLEDLTASAGRYRELLNKSQTLQKELDKANEDLEIEKNKTEYYEKRLTKEREIDESLVKNEMLLYHEWKEMEKGIADRDVYIIVLQMKLLAEKEEVEKLKNKVEELNEKNERMSTDLRRVSQSYNQERCQSLKLSECIKIQGDEILKIDELKKQLRECKYKNIIVAEERESKIQELIELKKWTEALKTRFDAIEKEKQSSIEKNEKVSSNCVLLQETVWTLNQKLSSAQLELEEMKKRSELQAKDCELYKTQRNNALEARKQAVIEKDKVIAEKNFLQAEYNELLARREQINEERADLLQNYDLLHARYKTSSEDLTRVKTALNEKEMEVEDLIRKLREASDKNKRNSKLLENIPGVSDLSEDDDDNTAAEQLGDDTADADEETDFRQPWRERTMKSLLHSIKSRISRDRAEDGAGREHVSLVAGNVTIDVLQHLLPNLSTRPTSVESSPKLSRTLQRQRCLRQKKSEHDVLEMTKARSKTAPCCSSLLPDDPAFEQDFQRGVKSAMSAPNLVDSDDVDLVPVFFRSRSRNLTQKYRRTKSIQ